MSFDVPADAYDRYMGRYSRQLSAQMADLAGVRAGQRVLDVGCGPGALTAELVTRLGADAVAAVDPSEPFVAAARAAPSRRRRPAGVRRAAALRGRRVRRRLAQLVVHFMADPVAGLTEMARVTRPDGVVAACVWDHASDQGPLSHFWQRGARARPRGRGRSQLAGAREGHLARVVRSGRAARDRGGGLTASLEHASFDAWWEPFTYGVGPPGPTWRASTPTGRRSCAKQPERCSRPSRSSSPPGPGPPAAWPDAEAQPARSPRWRLRNATVRSKARSAAAAR